MIVKKIVTQDHPEDTEQTLLVSTDSSIERDIIIKYLSQAEKDYKAWIRKLTKGENKNGK